MSPSRRLCSRTAIVENLSVSPISAAVRMTPLMHPAPHTYISCASGMSIPVCTMFHVPRAGDEYSSPDLNGAGKSASAMRTPGILTCPVFPSLPIFFSILSVSVIVRSAVFYPADLNQFLSQCPVLLCHFALRKSLDDCLAQVLCISDRLASCKFSDHL